MSTIDATTHAALALLRSDADYLRDARRAAAAGAANTLVGGVLALANSIPRQYAEAAVRRALDAMEEGR